MNQSHWSVYFKGTLLLSLFTGRNIATCVLTANKLLKTKTISLCFWNIWAHFLWFWLLKNVFSFWYNILHHNYNQKCKNIWGTWVLKIKWKLTEKMIVIYFLLYINVEKILVNILSIHYLLCRNTQTNIISPDNIH